MPTLKKSRRNCKHCGKEVSRPEKFYCNNKCQREYEYNKYIKDWLDGKISGTQPNGLRVSSHVRRWLIEHRGECCEQCGWNERNKTSGKIPIEVSHKDGNSQDSQPSNLELLCPNHHSLTSSFRALNKGKGRIQRRNRIVAIAPVL